MHIIQANELYDFLEELHALAPQSLPVYKLAENHLLKTKRAWPGIEFVVDRFPHFEACVVRPCRNNQNYVPRRSGMVYNAAGKSPTALKALLRHPDIVDWNHAGYFQLIPRELRDAVLEVCREKGKAIGPVENEDFAGSAYIVRTNELNSVPHVPDGFVLNDLRKADLSVVSKLWRFGGGTSQCLEYLNHLISNDFPTTGLFTHNGELIGFGLCNSEMAIAALYVKPEHRGRRFAEMIMFRLCTELRERGQNLTFAFISDSNIASQKAIERLGGKKVDGWEVIWVLYRPLATEKSDPLIVWYNNIYAESEKNI